DAFIAADNVPAILEHKPIGLEGFDAMLTGFMRRKKLAEEEIAMLPEGNGYLLVEFGGWSVDEVENKARRFCDAMQSLPVKPATRLYSEQDAKRIWFVRESALGATVFVPGEPHGWEGWEDSAVPPEKLGSYLRQLFALMDQYGYRSPMYGHFGQGCVHLRINFDLESSEGIAKFRDFIDRAADIVVAHGGSFSGEHGDGQARSALLPKMFGPELIQAFREFKALWDPDNRMNPGKLSGPDEIYGPADNLRLGAGYKSHRENTFFQFPDDRGSFSEATLRCVGVGACRKQDAGTMCPSYMATCEEGHSTRGRAHLLWELFEGNVLDHHADAANQTISPDWSNEAVKEALDLCLSCKACKSECPVNVDVATYKAEFLAHYYQRHRRHLRDYAFGFMDKWARIASVVPEVTPRLANLPLRFPGASHAIKAILGVAPQRNLPQFASRTFRSQNLRSSAQATKTVLLWPDTWNNFYHPQTLTAAQRVLETAGFAVILPSTHLCCGRPLYDFGFLPAARRYLLRILETLDSQIGPSVGIVFLEPSCASVLHDELRNFFPQDPRATRLRAQSYLLSDFLASHAPDYQPPSLAGQSILIHGHCHHKSAYKMTSELDILRRTGAEVALLDSGCCGMAGPFGFEREKFNISQALAERVLLPAIRQASPATLVVTDGFSCREQIAQNSTRKAFHLAEVLAGSASRFLD
ncbi:MAG TPA: FAD-linked oxidase C-terminal domain-containing protein, partial [Terriglobia bacterium]|nr:FAD-linked oxidase C-terminal domain-containing protein [Terriglobia bacterium]